MVQNATLFLFSMRTDVALKSHIYGITKSGKRRICIDHPAHHLSRAAGKNRQITRKRRIHRGIAGIDPQHPAWQAGQLRRRGHHVNVLAPDARQDACADLLIAATEETALTADDAHDDARLPLTHQRPELALIDIAGNALSVLKDIDTEQGTPCTEAIF